MKSAVDKIEIGRRIREFRKKAGLSQEKLAEAIDMSFQQVQKYEKGISRLTPEKLLLIANALKISVYAFYDGYIDAPFQLNKDERDLIEAFRGITTESVKHAILTLTKNSAKRTD